MGKLIKNHLARLIVMTAASYQILAALIALFWPKFLFDFFTTNFDAALKPVPILQILNLLFGTLALLWEYPLPLLAGSAQHQSIELRLLLLPLGVLMSVLMYQSTNAGLYYLMGMVFYFWGFCEGEIVCERPWSLPKRQKRVPRVELLA